MDVQDMNWAQQLLEEQRQAQKAKSLSPAAQEAVTDILKSRCMMPPSEIRDFMETVQYGLNEPGADMKSLLREALPQKMKPGFKTGIVADLLPFTAEISEPSPTAQPQPPKPKTQTFTP